MIKRDITTSMHSEMEELAIVGFYIGNSCIVDTIESHRLHRINNNIKKFMLDWNEYVLDGILKHLQEMII